MALSHECSQHFLQKLLATGWHPSEEIGKYESWGIDGPSNVVSNYETLLANIFRETGNKPDGFIGEFIRQRKKKGQGVHLLDLFGSGFVFAFYSPIVDSITGVRFGPYDRSKLPSWYPVDNVPFEVTGDIMNPVTWETLDRSMQDRSIPRFDLVLMNPVMGWPIFKTAENADTLALCHLINEVAQRLSPSGSFFFRVNFKNGAKPGKELIELEDLFKSRSSHHRLVMKTLFDYDQVQVEGFTGALLPKRKM